MIIEDTGTHTHTHVYIYICTNILNAFFFLKNIETLFVKEVQEKKIAGALFPSSFPPSLDFLPYNSIFVEILQLRNHRHAWLYHILWYTFFFLKF